MSKTRRTAAAVAVLALAGATAACGTTADAAEGPATAVQPAADTGSAAGALPTEDEVAGLFDTWNEALATGDAETVADLYAPDAVLLPTLSDEIRSDREELVEYFTEDFLPKQPQGVVTESEVFVIDEDSASHSGNYDFTITNSDGTTSVVPARFTYVYEKTGDDWLITTHHSSAQPAS